MFHSQAKNSPRGNEAKRQEKTWTGPGQRGPGPMPKAAVQQKGPQYIIDVLKPERRNPEARNGAVAALSTLPRENDNILIT